MHVYGYLLNCTVLSVIAYQFAKNRTITANNNTYVRAQPRSAVCTFESLQTNADTAAAACTSVL